MLSPGPWQRMHDAEKIGSTSRTKSGGASAAGATRAATAPQSASVAASVTTNGTASRALRPMVRRKFYRFCASADAVCGGSIAKGLASLANVAMPETSSAHRQNELVVRPSSACAERDADESGVGRPVARSTSAIAAPAAHSLAGGGARLEALAVTGAIASVPRILRSAASELDRNSADVPARTEQAAHDRHDSPVAGESPGAGPRGSGCSGAPCRPGRGSRASPTRSARRSRPPAWRGGRLRPSRCG